MNKFSKAIPTAFAGVFLAATVANAEVYLCEFSDPGRYNTIPPKILLDLKPNGAIEVTDAYLLNFKQAPKVASFTKNTTARLRVRWTIDRAELGDGGVTDMKYSLNFNKQNNRASVTLQMPNYDNTDSGNGHCEIVAEK